MHEELKLEKPAVLCVEPDPETAESYKAILAPEYQLTLAATAFDALRESNRRAFDAYVLEYWLPDWPGPSLCNDLRESDPHAAVIFCAGSARDVDRERAIKAGANAYLVKPLHPDLLLGKLRALLELRAADSIRARAAAQGAAHTELERRLKARREGLTTALGGAERVARKKALAAFTHAGGTRAHFERMWLEMLVRAQFESGFTAHEVEMANGKNFMPAAQPAPTPPAAMFGIAHSM